MTQPSLHHLLPLALLPFATSAFALNANCAPTASALSVPLGGSVTLTSNCVDEATNAAIPEGSLNWEAVVGGVRQAIGTSSLPNGTLTVAVPNLPGEVTYQLVSGDAGYGGPIIISQFGNEGPPASVSVNVFDPCTVPPAAARPVALARRLVVADPTCGNNPGQPTTGQTTLGQISAPLMTAQTAQTLNNLDVANKRMRALRASRNTALLDLQGIPLPQSTNSDAGSEARKQRFGLYVTGLGDYLRQNGTATQAEFRSRTTSLSVGADYRFNDDWVAGGNLGYSNGKVDFSGSSSEQKSKGTQATAYAAWSVTPTTYVSATLSYEANRFELTRDDGAQQLSYSRPKGSGVGLSLSAGRDFVTGPWSIGPYVRWDNVTSRVSAFDESGSASAVSVGAQRIQSNAINAGAQTQLSLPVSWGILLPYVRLELSHRNDKTRQAATATLINGNTTLLVPTAADTSGTYGNVALGVAGVNQGGTSWFADYETGVAQKGYRTRRIGLGLRFEL